MAVSIEYNFSLICHVKEDKKVQCLWLLAKARGHGGNLIRTVYIKCLSFKSTGSAKKLSDPSYRHWMKLHVSYVNVGLLVICMVI